MNEEIFFAMVGAADQRLELLWQRYFVNTVIFVCCAKINCLIKVKGLTAQYCDLNFSRIESKSVPTEKMSQKGNYTTTTVN